MSLEECVFYVKRDSNKKDMLYFQSEFFESSDGLSAYIIQVLKLKTIIFLACRVKIETNAAPFFNFGAQTEIGARIAVPVTK